MPYIHPNTKIMSPKRCRRLINSRYAECYVNGKVEGNGHKSNDEVCGKDASTDDVNGSTLPVVSSKKESQQKEMTFHDIFSQDFDEEDDEFDDSDWDPHQRNVELVKWFCTNCTMVNLGDDVHCETCGEHRESGILKRGFLASSSLPDAGVNEVGSDTREN